MYRRSCPARCHEIRGTRRVWRPFRNRSSPSSPFVALISHRYGGGARIGLSWIANLVGILDLANALVQGIRFHAGHLPLGSFCCVVTVLVPILWITHVMSFIVLLRRPR